jgi:hypothetical protein
MGRWLLMLLCVGWLSIGCSQSPPAPTNLELRSTSLPVGALVHDGPATPEQLSLLLPVTGSLPQTATATVRYKPGSSTWLTGHPLYRIRPTMIETPTAGGPVPDAFAWPILDLMPGTAYDVEVTITSEGTSDLRTASFTTRSIPAPAGAPNKTISAGSSTATIQAALDGLKPGDVLQFDNGTYTLSPYLILRRSGTPTNPIYIRGASRTGVVLSSAGRIWYILDAHNIVLENMSHQGSGVDSGTAARSEWIKFFGDTRGQSRITVRHNIVTGVDKGIVGTTVTEVLVYDNTLTGNNTWTGALLTTNATWNDDGINLPGTGNCAFNNTIKGFGDSLAFAEGGHPDTLTAGVHYYRNDVRNSDDDFVEADYAFRNISIYDNRLHNAMTFLSLDPLYGGPLVFARNILINVGRQPFKWNSQNSGQFIYNNTMVRTTGRQWLDGQKTAEAGWINHANGDQKSYGYRNNILIYRGASTQVLRLNNSGHTPVDFTHNSWYPGGLFEWPQGSFATLAAAYRGLAATSPIFSNDPLQS